MSSSSPSPHVLLSSHSACTTPFVSPFSASTVSRTPATVEECADAASPPDSPKSVSSSTSSASSGSSVEAVQFLSAVHVGDYVALRPFAPTDDGGRLLQGYVQEFACTEPFQADGVLAVLGDNTIGYVAMVLDSAQGSSSETCSSAAAAATAAAAAPSSKKRGGKSNTSRVLSVAFPVDPNSAPGSSRPEAALGITDGSAQIDEWMMDLPALMGAAESATLQRRSAAEAERDLQLWHDFEALQKQHGEALCNSILESCNYDFAEAMELIKSQGSSLSQAGTSAASPRASSAAAGAGSPSAHRQQSPTAAAAAGASAAAAPTATAADEGLVQQLALSLGLLPDDALQLARLVPHLPAEVVVQELLKHNSDVGLAADALLSGSATQEQQEHEAAAVAAAGASTPTAGSISTEVRAAQSFMSTKDPASVLAAQQLREISPGLSLDMAHLLIQEHGGDISEVRVLCVLCRSMGVLHGAATRRRGVRVGASLHSIQFAATSPWM